MRRLDWQIVLGLTLIAVSVLFYLVHYAFFRDAHHIFIFLLGDVAFVFIEVLLVTLIIHRVLAEREKRSMLEKLNMIIGAFYSEVGSPLLAYFSDFDPRLEQIRNDLVITAQWCEEDFSKISRRLKSYKYGLDIHKVDLETLRDLLGIKRDFLLRLLENPNLLEHESFTGLLMAVFHLMQELVNREDLTELPETDKAHLVADMERAYSLLVYEWLNYMRHLESNYPYLFSLAMRTNPFDKSASPVVR